MTLPNSEAALNKSGWLLRGNSHMPPLALAMSDIWFQSGNMQTQVCDFRLKR